MASVLARQATRNARVACLHARAIHSTPLVLKKKREVIIDDLFGENSKDDSDDLFGAKPQKQAAEPVTKAAQPTPDAPAKPAKYKQSPERRNEKFETLFVHVADRIGKRPKIAHPPMRHSAWTHLFDLATTAEQLTRVSDMFYKFKDGGAELRDEQVELFVRRCQQLDCSDLALKVFGNFSAYSVKLTVPAARQLLHSLHAKRPLSEVMTAASLFQVYNLPPISADLVSCSLVVDACLRDGSPEALQVGDALLGPLQTLIGKGSGNANYRLPAHPRERAKDKPRVWTVRALEKVDRLQARRPEGRLPWLEEWRKRNGLLKSKVF